MACRYYYKGHLFDNELALDDFLLEALPFESELGDLVFDDDRRQLGTRAAMKAAKEAALKLRALYDELKNSENYGEDGIPFVNKPPYYSVTRFLTDIRTEDGTQLFPEMRFDNYFELRLNLWKDPSIENRFTPDELDEFGVSPDSVINDPNAWATMRKDMEKRWKDSGHIGTAIHKVMEVLFTYNSEDKDYVFRKDSDDLLRYIWGALLKSGDHGPYINNKAIISLINYAKELDRLLTARFGTGLIYSPEFRISAETTDLEPDGKNKKLMGIIDLLVVDSQGRAHIVDYKTSTHSFAEQPKPKKLSYTYQTLVYLRMLELSGIPTREGDVLIANIKLDGFRRDEDGSHIFDDVEAPVSLISVNTLFNPIPIMDNIDSFLPSPFKLSITSALALEATALSMHSWFDIDFSNDLKKQEEVIAELKLAGALKPDENGVYKYNRGGGRKPIIAKSEEELVIEVTKYLNKLPRDLQYLTSSTKMALRLAIINRSVEGALFPNPIYVRNESQTNHMHTVLLEYCTGTWEIVDNPLLEGKGIIVVKTIDGINPRQIDIIRISTNNLIADPRGDKKGNLRNRKLLTSKFTPDITYKSRKNSLMLELCYGNLELMETLLLLNLTEGLEGYVIGDVNVINPLFANSLNASNEELLYCWSELNRYKPVAEDKFKSGRIKFARHTEKVYSLVCRLLAEGELALWKDAYTNLGKMALDLKDFRADSTSVLDTCINGSVLDLIRKLEELNSKLVGVTSMGNTISNLNRTTTFDTLQRTKEALLHYTILKAIAYLKGIDFKLQLRDHDNWCDSLNFFREGFSGLMLDNPGNMESDTLNIVDRLLRQAYLNTRDYMMREKSTIDKFISKLRNINNMGYLKRHTIGNQAGMYTNMIEHTPEGDILFKDPNTLTGVEKEFLEYVLDKINRNRFPSLSTDDLQKMKDTGDINYYRVPITRGSLDSKVEVDGLMDLLISKLRFFNPKTAMKNAYDSVAKMLNTTSSRDEVNSQALFRLTNEFDRAERSDNRLALIQEIGMENIEHNLESLIYKHLYAYAVRDNINAVFPLIKAAYIHIATLGSLLNNSFSNDLGYLKKYIKSKIFGESIQDKKLTALTKVLATLRSAASKMTLAFSPIQALYLPLMGLWVDTRLYFKYRGISPAFTFKNFKRALAVAYADAFKFTDEPTFCSSINMLYALNDMDTREYADLINSSKAGIYNFWKFALKATTRPDYYNRLTIFFCLMMGDGCFDAHYMLDGKLVYDWTKDKRFDAFARGDTSDPRYNELKSLYYTIGKLFEAEGVRNPDGTLFVLNMEKPMALPRAYTSEQAESMKSLADDMYGYYSDEKKSMVHSMWLGAMWMQFKTFWSGKKNQYLQSGGVRLRGTYKHITFDGKPQYYQVIDGVVRHDLPFTEEVTEAPVMQWSGLWQEGIILTLSDLVMESINNKSLKVAWNSIWDNPDPNLQSIYRSNLRLAGYDIVIWMLGGMVACSALANWVNSLKKENEKKHDPFFGIQVATLNVLLRSLKNSFLDFNVYHTVGAPGFNWQPFMFNWASREAKNIWNLAVGDESFWDALVRTTSATNSIKPFFDSIKPEELYANKKS